MTAQWQSYLSQQRDNHLNQLKELLRIPSVSTLSEHRPDMRKAADWLAQALMDAGMEHVEVLPTEGCPVVYGDWLHAEGKPTALVYGHYDVQPADPLGEWKSPPFEPDIRDGKLYARGATDDKGQLFLHVKAVEAMMKTAGKLPLNLKFLLEGEEEISSPHLEAFIREHLDRLKADVAVISDGPMLAKGQPSIPYALRGLCGLQVDVRGLKSDVHSGLYGGGVPNAINALCGILASLHDAQGRIAVEGFYDGVRELDDTEREQLRQVPLDEEQVRKDLGAPALAGESGYTYLERTTARPTLDIGGISGGFQGEGIKSIIPAAAQAKISCRLVDGQQPDRVMDKIEEHIRRGAPDSVEVRVTRLVKGNPFSDSYEDPYYQAASEAYKATYGTEALFVREGASIPILEVLKRLLGARIVNMGFGLPDENLHAPNEHFDLENFDRGLPTICRYWELLGNLQV